MSKPLVQTITITTPVSRQIEDLVRFFQYCCNARAISHNLTDQDLIDLADSFWDRQHGEDD